MDIMGIALAGMESASASFDASARRFSDAAADSSVDTVDLSTGAVELLDAKSRFAVNTEVARTADDMQKQILDLLA
jgi:flagellar hook protein FlgE